MLATRLGDLGARTTMRLSECSVARPSLLLLADATGDSGLLAALRAEGYTLTVASADVKLSAWIGPDPDVILADLRSGDGDASQLCARIRTQSDAPIVMLAAPRDEAAVVRAIDAGADQYVPAPCGTAELLARVRAALRRGRSRNRSKIMEHGPLRIDAERHEVRLGGSLVHLTPKEYDLLLYLARHAGKVLTHAMILRDIWGAGAEDDRALLHVYVGQVRRKIERDPRHPSLILTVPGVGYRLASPSTATRPAEHLKSTRSARMQQRVSLPRADRLQGSKTTTIRALLPQR